MMTSFVVVLALLSSATTAPPSPDANIATVDKNESEVRDESRREFGARYIACRRLLIEDESPALARGCFQRLVDEGDNDADVASEMAQFAASLDAHQQREQDAANGNADALSERFILSGAPELLVTGAAYGAVFGFLSTATVQSWMRTDTGRATPWLLGVPSLGVVAGAVLGAGIGMVATPGDAAMVSSSTFAATGWGVALQLILLDGNDDVGAIPLRFLIPLLSSVAVGSVSAVAAPFVDVTPGDASLATSAALITPLVLYASMTAFLFAMPTSALTGMMQLGAVTAVSASAYAGTLLLSPIIDIARPVAWLVDLGAIAGAIGVTAMLPLLAIGTLWGAPYVPAVYPALYAGGIATGALVGLTSAFLVTGSVAFIDDLPLENSPLSFAPFIAPDVVDPNKLSVGFAVQGGFSL